MDFTKNENVIAIPPGVTILEQLQCRGMSQKEFSILMDISEEHTRDLISGKIELTPYIALKLESVLGIPAKFWNNMESYYKEQLERCKE